MFAAKRIQDGRALMIKWARKAEEGQALASRASEISQLASDSLLKPVDMFEHQGGVYIVIGHSV